MTIPKNDYFAAVEYGCGRRIGRIGRMREGQIAVEGTVCHCFLDLSKILSEKARCACDISAGKILYQKYENFRGGGKALSISNLNILDLWVCREKAVKQL